MLLSSGKKYNCLNVVRSDFLRSIIVLKLLLCRLTVVVKIQKITLF